MININYKIVSGIYTEFTFLNLLKGAILPILFWIITQGANCALPTIEGNTTLTDRVENEPPSTHDHGNNHGLKNHEFVFIAVICLWVIGACYGACCRKK